MIESDKGRRGRLLNVIICILLLAISIPFMMSQVDEVSAVRYVGPNSTYKNLTAALSAAGPGETIFIETGTYNGTFTINKDGIALAANFSSIVTIELNGSGSLLDIDADNITLSNLILSGGSVDIKGNNTSINGCILDSSKGTELSFEDSDTIEVTSMFLNPPGNGGLLFSNCSSIDIDGFYGERMEGTGIDISGSVNINITNCIVELNSSATWISISDSGNININNSLLTNSNSSNNGLLFSNVSTLVLDNLDITLSGTSIDIWNSATVDILNCSIEQASGTGINADIVLDMDLFQNNIDTYGSSTGILLDSVRDMDMMGQSFMLYGEGSIGMETDRIDDFHISFLSATAMGEGTELASLEQPLNGRLDNITINLAGRNCSGLDVSSGYNISLSTSMMTSTGYGATILKVSNTPSFSLSNNRFDASGSGSIAVMIDPGTALSTLQNQITTSGMGSCSFLVDGSLIAMKEDKVSVRGEMGKGISSMSSNLNIEEIELEVPGSDSVGWESDQDNNNILRNSTIGVIGMDSLGIHISPGQFFGIYDSDILGGVDSDDMISIHESSVETVISDVNIGSSGQSGISIIDAPIRIINSSIETSGNAIFLMNSTMSKIEGSLISGYVPIASLNSTLHQSETVINYTMTSHDIIEGSLIQVIDSTGIMPNVDPTSELFVMNSIDVRTLDRFGEPLSGVEIEITNWDETPYSTDHFTPGSTDDPTDSHGYIPRIPMLYSHYNGSNDPTYGSSKIEVYLEGSSSSPWSEVYTINTSYPHTELLRSPDIDVPQVPQNLSIIGLQTDQKVFLQWELNEDDTTEYWIYERILPSGSITLADKVPYTNATWRSQDLGPSTSVAYWITAWDGTWQSKPSDIVVETTVDLEPPMAPSAIFHDNVSESSISLRWTHSGATDLAGFSIVMNSTASHMEYREVARTAASARGVVIDGLEWGTVYSFKVRAYDLSDNWSPYTEPKDIWTLLPSITVRLNVSYTDSGPLAGLSAAGSSYDVILEGIVVFSGNITSSDGIAEISGLDAGRNYSFRIHPPINVAGAIGEKTGYLVKSTEPLFTDPNYPLFELDIDLDYYYRVLNGTIRIAITFTDGPREGDPVYGAKVNLLSESNVLIGTKLSDGDGKASFTIDTLPFRGRFQIEPPFDLKGDPVNEISGYLGTTTNFFQLTEEASDGGEVEAGLGYYDYIPPVEELEIVSYSPSGDAVDLNINLIITFNQAVDTDSARQAISITPALKNIRYSWSNSNRTVTIQHDELVPETEYTVTVGMNIRSEDDTGFPSGYQNNTWAFTTTGLPDDPKPSDNNDRTILIIAAIVVLVVIAFLIYSRFSTRKQEEEDVYSGDYMEYGDDYEDDFYDALDGMDDDYPDDIAESMMAGGIEDEGLLEEEDEEFEGDEEEDFVKEEALEVPEEHPYGAGLDEEVDEELIGDIEDIESEEELDPDEGEMAEETEMEEEEEEEPPKKKPKKKKKTKKKKK